MDRSDESQGRRAFSARGAGTGNGYFEPPPRYGATGCVVNGKFYLLGGFLDGYPSEDHEAVPPLTCLHTFDGEDTLTWTKHAFSNQMLSPPEGVVYPSCVHYRGKLYYFGGYDCKTRTNALFCVALMATLECERVEIENPDGGPMQKCSCGMVVDDEGKLWVVGGYGRPPSDRDPDGDFVRNDAYLRGWTNEVHRLDLRSTKSNFLFGLVHNLLLSLTNTKHPNVITMHIIILFSLTIN